MRELTAVELNEISGAGVIADLFEGFAADLGHLLFIGNLTAAIGRQIGEFVEILPGMEMLNNFLEPILGKYFGRG